MKKWMVVFLVLIGMRGMGQVPTWEWARDGICNNSGGGGADVYGIASDNIGNVYLTGYFTDTLSFGSYTLINHSYLGNVFTVKYDSSGNLIWAVCANDSARVRPYGIATDVFGNVFITGYFSTPTVTFGSFTLINNHSLYDIFIVKYDSNGNVIWANGIDGNGYDHGYAIATDALGNCYVTGTFDSPSLTFGTHTINNGGTTNIFLVKYDALGNAIWAQRAGGNYIDGGYGVSSDSDGNILLTGYFRSAVSYFGTDSLIRSGNSYNFFIAKYDSTGNEIWSRGANEGIGNFDCIGASIISDANANIYVTGEFNSPTIIFSSDTLTRLGNLAAFNCFVVKYDSAGNSLWAKNSLGNGQSIICDMASNVYVAGSIPNTYTTITFDTLTLNEPSGSDTLDPMFVVKYNSSGHAIYGLLLPSGGDDYSGVALGPSNSLYIGGDFFRINPYIFGNDSLILTGAETPFVAKLGYPIIEGIPIVSPQPTISLFPNPFSTSTTLLINGEIKENSHLYIYNLLGEEVKTIPIINQKEITINRDNLADGMYFYKIIGNNNESIATGKMIVE